MSNNTIIAIFIALCIYLIFHFSLRMIEVAYVLKYRKPFYVHFYPFLKKLNRNQKQVLTANFPFYNNLSSKQKSYFEHRVVCFIKDKDFIGRDGLVITDDILILISA